MPFQIEVGIKRRKKNKPHNFFLLFSVMHFELLLEKEHINHFEWLF